jgi:hypothetical protein
MRPRRLLALLAPFAAGLPCGAGEPKAAEPARLTKDGSFKQHLQWSPDGRKAPHFDGHWSHDSKKVVLVFDTLQGTDGKFPINTAAAERRSLGRRDSSPPQFTCAPVALPSRPRYDRAVGPPVSPRPARSER